MSSMGHQLELRQEKQGDSKQEGGSLSHKTQGSKDVLSDSRSQDFPQSLHPAVLQFSHLWLGGNFRYIQ